MNCCDASTRCNEGTGCPARGSSAADLRFAPGAIERHRRPLFGNPAQRRELRRWAVYLAMSIALCALAAAAGGFIAGVAYSLHIGT